jgi:hypothetical protein
MKWGRPIKAKKEIKMKIMALINLEAPQQIIFSILKINS